MKTHGLICDFGRFKGERYTRIPVSYLKWMICVGLSHKHIAEAELKRRGTVTPEVDISAHAIDRISQRYLNKWNFDRKYSKSREGLHSWIVRKATEALKRDDRTVDGIKFVFDEGGAWPVLKTVK